MELEGFLEGCGECEVPYLVQSELDQNEYKCTCYDPSVQIAPVQIAPSPVPSPDPCEPANYGNKIYLQVNSLDYRWLTGGRNSGNYDVQTRNGFTETDVTSYQWIVRSSIGDGTRTFPDPKEGDCLQYGDKIYLPVNTLDRRWLTGGRTSGNEVVETRDFFSDTGNFSEYQ